MVMGFSYFVCVAVVKHLVNSFLFKMAKAWNLTFVRLSLYMITQSFYYFKSHIYSNNIPFLSLRNGGYTQDGGIYAKVSNVSLVCLNKQWLGQSSTYVNLTAFFLCLTCTLSRGF